MSEPSADTVAATAYLALQDELRLFAKERDEARADAERMREALSELREWQPWTDGGLKRLHPQHREAVEKASAILGEEMAVTFTCAKYGCGRTATPGYLLCAGCAAARGNV